MYQTSSTSVLSSTSTGIPTSVPAIIWPPGGIVSQPRDTSLVQIGFSFGLNYNFVADNGASADQIFAFLPAGIAYGLGIKASNVTMYALQPYDTTKDLGYITTLALAYVPTSAVNNLSLQLKTAISNMYANPDRTVSTLMAMLNPSFPVLAGQTLASAASATGSAGLASASAASQANNAAAPLTNAAPANGPTKSVSSTTVGISIGVASGALLYGAAIFFVARRYRKKKAAHARTSSTLEGSHPSFGYEDSMGQRYGSMMGAGAVMSGTNGLGPQMSGGSGGYGTRYPSGHPSGGYTDEVMDNRRNTNGHAYNGRQSQGSSGQLSNGRSVREMAISRPVMTENSLGWH